MKIDEVIVRPVLTEKGTAQANRQVYMFEVNLRADKNQIKAALEKIFKVKVARVNIMLRKGKERKVGKRMLIKKQTDKKIAFVKLKEGKIDLFPQT